MTQKFKSIIEGVILGILLSVSGYLAFGGIFT
jgi:hypothetical protein